MKANKRKTVLIVWETSLEGTADHISREGILLVVRTAFTEESQSHQIARSLIATSIQCPRVHLIHHLKTRQEIRYCLYRCGGEEI